MVEMLGTMLIQESSELEDTGLVENKGYQMMKGTAHNKVFTSAGLFDSKRDEMMKSRALNKIFTSADPMDRSLVSIADISLNRDA